MFWDAGENQTCTLSVENVNINTRNRKSQIRQHCPSPPILVMALSQQQVTASNSLVSCWTVIACCCSYQTPATFMLRFLSLPYSNPWEPLQSKQKLHEQCSFLSFLSLEESLWNTSGATFTKEHSYSANILLLVLTTEHLQCCSRGVDDLLKDSREHYILFHIMQRGITSAVRLIGDWGNCVCHWCCVSLFDIQWHHL